MKQTWLLVGGALVVIGFAWMVLVGIPHTMLVRVEAPPGLEPYTESQARGRTVYIRNGCIYCHTQQVRDDAFTSDVARGWGRRPTVPADYVYDRPHLMGTMRTGPDLINVGIRLPDPEWHLIHFYDPRAVVEWSIMPPYRFLFDEVPEEEVGPDDRVVAIPGRGPDEPVVVATPDVLALVDYLRSLNRSYPLAQPAGAAEDAGIAEPGEPAEVDDRSGRTMP